METSLEMKILRMLAVVALIAATVIGLFIVSDSGIIGGANNTSDSGAKATGTVTETVTATEAEPEAATPSEVPSEETQTQTQTVAYEEYTVKQGDSFATIAAEHGTTIAEIQKLNPDVNSNNMHVGDVLKVPATSP